MDVQYLPSSRSGHRRAVLTAMNAADLQPLPEVLLGPHPPGQPGLNLASEGVQRYVWQSTFGAMLIEVKDGAAYVNGQRVTPIQELREHD